MPVASPDDMLPWVVPTSVKSNRRLDVSGFSRSRRAEGGHHLAVSQPAGAPRDLDAADKGASLFRREDPTRRRSHLQTSWRPSGGRALAQAVSGPVSPSAREAHFAGPLVGLQVLLREAGQWMVRLALQAGTRESQGGDDPRLRGTGERRGSTGPRADASREDNLHDAQPRRETVVANDHGAQDSGE